nr:MAG TPA: colicin-M immunity protein [Caudoviricetes sp.]
MRSGRYAIWGCFYPCWVVPLIVRGARLVWRYFAKYNGGIFYVI